MKNVSGRKIYDLAVMGGGIAGVAVARDAALRGLSVVLLEKNALGSGASSKSSKLIHGGIRYLELAWDDLRRLHGISAFKNFRFVFASLRESHILQRIARRHVRPLRLVVPIYRGQSRSRLAMHWGCRLYGALSRLAGNPVRTRIFSGPESVLAELPLLKPEGLLGGVEIIDHTTDDLELVQAVADSARRSGAEILVQAKALSWAPSGDGYRLTVEILRRESFVDARAVVNATGAWIDKTRGRVENPADRYVYPVGGSHIEVAAFLGRSAVLEAQDGRIFFVVEKEGRARVGTTEWPAADPDDVRVPEADVDYLLGALSRYFPRKKWTYADVLASDAGLRPLAVDRRADSINRLSREHRITKDADGVWHLAGVKLTDHRRAAQETVDRVVRTLGRPAKRCVTACTPLEPEDL